MLIVPYELIVIAWPGITLKGVALWTEAMAQERRRAATRPE